MEELLIGLIKTQGGQGVFFVLFVGILLYVLKENAGREANYRGIIKILSEDVMKKLIEIEERLPRL